jgi:hypothetical protein
MSLGTRKKGSNYFKQTQLCASFACTKLLLHSYFHLSATLKMYWTLGMRAHMKMLNPFMTDPIKWWLQKYSHKQVVFLYSWVKFVCWFKLLYDNHFGWQSEFDLFLVIWPGLQHTSQKLPCTKLCHWIYKVHLWISSPVLHHMCMCWDLLF